MLSFFIGLKRYSLLVFGEESESLRPDFMRIQRRIFHTPGRTHMCSNPYHKRNFDKDKEYHPA
jgi:hypothetical protein